MYSHVVAGIEGSGTEWMSNLLASHPDVRSCCHQSYPYGWPGAPYRPLTEIWPLRDVPVLVMLRDRWCSEKSRYNRHFAEIHPDHMDRDLALGQLLADIADWAGPRVFVSYEGLIDLGQPYFDIVLGQLGLARGLPLTVRDENKKYIAP